MEELLSGVAQSVCQYGRGDTKRNERNSSELRSPGALARGQPRVSSSPPPTKPPPRLVLDEKVSAVGDGVQSLLLL